MLGYEVLLVLLGVLIPFLPKVIKKIKDYLIATPNKYDDYGVVALDLLSDLGIKELEKLKLKVSKKIKDKKLEDK